MFRERERLRDGRVMNSMKHKRKVWTVRIVCYFLNI